MDNTKKNKGIVKAIFSVSFIIIIAKILGFIKQIFIAKTFGATIETDIVMLSQGVVTDFEYLLSQTMITAFVPIYVILKAEGGEKEREFTGKVFTVFSGIVLLITSTLFFAAPLVAKVLAPSYTGTSKILLIKHVRIYSIILIVLFLLALFNALLKANKIFVPGELLSVNQSLIFIFVIFIIGNRFGADSLVVAFFVYALFNLVYLMIYARNFWDGPKFLFYKDENITSLFRMIGPLLLGYSMIYVNQQVDKILATGLGDGTVTALTYSAVLSNLVTGVIGSLSGVIFTYVATHVAEKKDKYAANLIGDMMVLFVTILLPISLITIMNSKEIVGIVYGRGAFDLAAVKNATAALMGYGFVFVPFVIRELFTRLQYSYQDTKRPMINSILSIFINIVLSIILSRRFGIFGITIASSISVIVCAILNVISSRKHNNHISFRRLIKVALHWGVGIIASMICIIVLRHITIGKSDIIRFILVSIGGLGVYFIIELPIVLKFYNSYKNRPKL